MANNGPNDPPTKATQKRSSHWVKGQSGNPRGRPRKKEISVGDRITNIVHEKVTITINGKVEEITMIEAVVRRALAMTLKSGSPRDLKLLFDLVRSYSPLLPEMRTDGRFITFEEQRLAGEAVMDKIMQTFERTVPDDELADGEEMPDWRTVI